MHWQGKSVQLEELALVPAKITFISGQRDRTKFGAGWLWHECVWGWGHAGLNSICASKQSPLEAKQPECLGFKQMRESQYWRGLRQLFTELHTALDTI